jgi:hypothetical protein
MPDPRKGVRVPLSPARKMVCELLRHGRRVPTVPVSRELDVAAAVAARDRHPARPSWVAVFMKAYGLIARRHPALRRVYMPYPWPHLYEHPYSECAVLIERDWRGEKVVLGAKVRGPEDTPVAAIDGHLRHFREAPVEEIGAFRQILRLGRLPWPARRFVFWQTLYVSGFKRAKRFGTFMVSSQGGLGAEQEHPIAPVTTYLTFGPIRDGRVTARLIYDHRVMDGRDVARALVDLEAVVNGEVAGELQNARRAA